MAEKSTVLQYKGQPLVRCGNKIYYGHPSEKAILVMTVLETKDDKGEDVPSRVLVQIQSTDEALSPAARILKESEKGSLADALEIGTIWLSRELKQ